MASTVTYNKLKFRIISSSGEDPDFPVSELMTQVNESKGWQTARFCDFPQSVTIQFFSPVYVKQMQFLSHQYKITTRIDILNYLPSFGMDILKEPNQVQYKRLGYLRFDSNEKTNYNSRELKSVVVDQQSLYMKFVFYKNHTNKFNLFNQIGIIAINAWGDAIKTSPFKDELQIKKISDPAEGLLDPATVVKLNMLEMQKDKAVREENFDEAKKIKDSIEKLKKVGIHIAKLEDRKNQAIEKEDFDTAKIIKAEIERMKHNVTIESINWRESKGGSPLLPQKEAPQIKSSKPAQGVESINPIVEPDESLDELKRISNKKIPYEDQVIPAITNKGKQNLNESLNQNETSFYEGEDPIIKQTPLTPEMLRMAEPLIPIIGEEIAFKIFSKKWMLREEGLKILEQELISPKQITTKEQASVFTAYFGTIAYTLSDKIFQIYNSSLGLLISLLQRNNGKHHLKQDFQNYLDGTYHGLAEKIGLNQQKIKEQSESALTLMCSNPNIGINNVVNFLINLQGHQKTANSTKHLVARLSNLSNIVVRHKGEIPFSVIADFAIKHSEHSNNEVRGEAIILLVRIYKTVGEAKMKPFLESMKHTQLELLQRELGIVSNSKSQKKNKDEKRKKSAGKRNKLTMDDLMKENEQQPQSQRAKSEKNSPNIKKKEQTSDPTNTSQNNIPKKSTNTDPNDNSKKCQFCGIGRLDFNENSKLNTHFTTECFMLVNCIKCAQIIEISKLNSHLLNECEMKKNFKDCSTCGLVMTYKDLDNHMKENKCSKVDKGKAKCPLCEKFLDDNPDSWVTHLVKEKCPKNPKK